MKIVLVTGTSMVPESARDYIASRGFEVCYIAKDTFTSAELAESLAGVSGYLIGGYEEPSAAHFEAATMLEAVAWVGTDYQANVPGWRRAMELGIAFLNSPGTNAVSVAEFTVLLMIAMARPFVERIAIPGEGPADLHAPGTDLYQRRLGIIGLGRIGARLARIAKLGLEMDVVYFGPHRHQQAEQALGISYATKDELLATCDVVSLHRPGPSASEVCELAKREFASMKDGALVLNTAHPRLVDEADLYWAITTKGIRAAQDGWGGGQSWEKLLKLGTDKFLAVPSMAFNTHDANLRASMATARGVCDVLSGGSSSCVNNPDFRAVRATR